MEIDSSNVLYLIGGPNGSGKTTLATSILKTHPKLIFLNPDEIARRQKLVYNASVGRVLFDQMHDIFLAHNSFLLETTLSGKFPIRLIQNARAAGYTIDFSYVVLSSVEQNLARVRNRVACGGHDVPENVIRRRHNKSLFNFDVAYKLADSWKLYDNAGNKCCLVARGFGDTVDVIEPEIYKFFLERKASAVEQYVSDMAVRRAERIQEKFPNIVKR